MNEGTKTGIFWAAAVVMLGIAMIVSWPGKVENELSSIVGKPLFDEFKDPLTAASLKIDTFDELKGTLESFEVRKDRQTGQWTIPSRKGYPADAVDQMKAAANALVALNVLDIQTENAEDHNDLGVAEPKLELLEVGDEGVGRLVTLKDESQKVLASLIIGDKMKDDASKVYVRKPGQDPVYVVRLDESPLTTRFRDWIEEDLLQLSSIDIQSMEIKDYNASVSPLERSVSLKRNYTANVTMDGSQWELTKLMEYPSDDPLAEPVPIEQGENEELNTTKLNEIKNALDDLKIVDVIRKPDGMSANLRADKDLLADEEAQRSLISRGFIPVPMGPQGEVEVLSANGDLIVSLKNGVQYLMRFGNVSGVSADDEAENDPEASVIAGVDRYMLVTTQIDEAMFPVPELKEVPQTLEDLEKLLKGDSAESSEQAEPESPEMDSEATVSEITDPDADTSNDQEDVADDDEEDTSNGEKSTEDSEQVESEVSDSADQQGPEAAAQDNDESKQKPEETAAPDDAAPDDAAPDDAKLDDAKLDDAKLDDAKLDDAKSESPETESPETESPETESPETESPETESPETESPETEPAAAELTETEPVAAEPAEVELTEEEKLERLESEQEKIIKENARKMDERKDKLEAARRRVRELNARFADWYYVIPEDTYRKLRVGRSEILQPKGADDENAASPMPPGGAGMPNFNFPGIQGN